MGVVDMQERVVRPRERRDRRQRRAIAVHREDPFGHDPGVAMVRPQLRELCLQFGQIIVGEGDDARPRQPGPRPQAGMGERIDEDEVLGSRKRRQRRDIGEVPRTEDDGILPALEGGEPLLELVQQRMRARDEPRGAGTRTVTPGRLGRRLGHPRVGGKPQIVVAREIDEHAPVDPHAAAGQHLRPPQPALQAPPRAFGQHALCEGGKIGQDFCPADSSITGIGPAGPDRGRSPAASRPVRGQVSA